MNTKNYSYCELPGHDSEFLNIVCIDDQCKNRRLLCCHCQLDHQGCKKIPIKRFTKIYQNQIDSKKLEQMKQSNKDLILHLEQIETILDNSQKFFHEIFNQIKSTIHNTKQSVNQIINFDSSKMNQSLILQQFETEPSYDNFISLLSEIESFKPNSDKISFTIKRNNPQLQISNEIFNNMKINNSEFQSAAQQFTQQYQHFYDTLKKNITNLFSKQHNNNDNQFQHIINQQQNQSAMQIEHNQNTLITNKEDKSNYQQQINELIAKPIQENLVEQQITNSKTKQYKSAIDQYLGQKSNSNKSPKITPTQNDNQLENYTELVVQDEISFQFKLEGQEITKILYINEYTVGVIIGQKCHIYNFSSQNSKNENLQSIQTIESDAEYTDLAYLKLNEQIGYIYLANKQGFIQYLITEGINHIKIKENSSQKKKIDKPGILQIQVSSENKQLYSTGDEMIIKIWSLDIPKELKRIQLKSPATAFHVDWNFVFTGGINSIQIWDQNQNQTNGCYPLFELEKLESRVKKILTNNSKLFLGFQDKIKIYDKKDSPFMLNLSKNVQFGRINLIHIIKTQNILVVSYFDILKQKVGLYDFTDDQPPIQLYEESAEICSVYEKDIVNYLVFARKMGKCQTYKMEYQSQMQQ